MCYSPTVRPLHTDLLANQWPPIARSITDSSLYQSRAHVREAHILAAHGKRKIYSFECVVGGRLHSSCGMIHGRRKEGHTAAVCCSSQSTAGWAYMILELQESQLPSCVYPEIPCLNVRDPAVFEEGASCSLHMRGTKPSPSSELPFRLIAVIEATKKEQLHLSLKISD